MQAQDAMTRDVVAIESGTPDEMVPGRWFNNASAGSRRSSRPAGWWAWL